MRPVTFVAQGLRKLTRYIENPRLVALRTHGVLPELYEKLDVPWFRDLNIATVIDIGAYIGRFAATMHAMFPNARIYAFEPLADCFAKLRERSRWIPRLTPLNVALGDRAGVTSFERNDFAPSSSVRRTSELQRTAFRITRRSRTVMVRMERLDDVVGGLVIEGPLLVKLDVQGYEDAVLRGGEQTIRPARVIIVETSFETLYEGQPLFDEIYRILLSWGFAYGGSIHQLSSEETGQALQEDSLFVKRSARE